MKQRRRAATPASSPPEPIELVLYVSGASPPSVRAVVNVRRLLERYHPGAIALTICDLALEPEQGERDQIAFTPTLCKRAPVPPMRILGDLSQPHVLIELLEFHGVYPTDGHR